MKVLFKDLCELNKKVFQNSVVTVLVDTVELSLSASWMRGFEHQVGKFKTFKCKKEGGEQKGGMGNQRVEPSLNGSEIQRTYGPHLAVRKSPPPSKSFSRTIGKKRKQSVNLSKVWIFPRQREVKVVTFGGKFWKVLIWSDIYVRKLYLLHLKWT